MRPAQVSHVGTNARALLENFANDPNFHGLLIVGMADTMYFGMPVIGLGGTAIHNYAKNDKPSQLTGLWLDRWLQKYLAFMDHDYRLSLMAAEARQRLAQGSRQPLRGRLEGRRDVPRPAILHVGPDRTAGYLQGHARHAWDGFKGPGVPPGVANKVIARSAEAVRRIRARGGDVMFIRPPSAPQLRVNEQKRIPRALGWDRLLVGAQCEGHPRGRSAASAEPRPPRMVTPQPQMRGGVYRRLRAAARRS